MKKQPNGKGMSTGAMIGTGVAVAAAGAAAYLLFGPEGKKNRKVVRGWAVKMKGEIIEKFEEAKELTEPVYQAIVDEVSAKYATVKGIDQKELANLVAEIRKHWKVVSGGAKKAKNTVKRKVKAVVKKTVKKVASKGKNK